MKRTVPPLIVTAVVGAALVPAPASASILINALPSSVACGDPIETGVWDRPDGQTGSTRVKIQLRSARGFVLRTRDVRARNDWRYFRFPVRCGRTYRVTYRNPQFGSETYKVRVRG